MTQSTDSSVSSSIISANPFPKHLDRRIIIPTLVSITLLALVINALGIPKNLPYSHAADEFYMIARAVNMASTGSLNPQWFGHPGSTLLYPMAAAYRLLFGPDSQTLFAESFWQFSIIGRSLSVIYGVLAIPLIFFVGRNSFGDIPGLIGSLSFTFYVFVVVHNQVIRTDSAAVFFGLLSIWRILKVDQTPTLKNQVLAGLTIGLSVSSRYFMVTLLPLLIIVDVLWWLRISDQRHELWLPTLFGLLMVPLFFALTTPYFILDWKNVFESLANEARTVHVGADGLSKPQNFLWYVTIAIPHSTTWLQYLLAIAGAIIVLLRNKTTPDLRRRELLVLSYIPLYLVTISVPALHWSRWLIPLLPIFTLLVGVALEWAASHFFTSRRIRIVFLLASVLLVNLWPFYQVILADIRALSPGTGVLAREWMIDNLSTQDRIALDRYAAPMAGTNFDYTDSDGLSTLATLEDFREQGYSYLVASSGAYQRYFDNPTSQPEHRLFYEQLFAEGELIREFVPSPTLSGPVIRVYRIDGGRYSQKP